MTSYREQSSRKSLLVFVPQKWKESALFHMFRWQIKRHSRKLVQVTTSHTFDVKSVKSRHVDRVRLST